MATITQLYSLSTSYFQDVKPVQAVWEERDGGGEGWGMWGRGFYGQTHSKFAEQMTGRLNAGVPMGQPAAQIPPAN